MKYDEEQQAEFQRQKDELERAKLAKLQQERREKVYHPSTGQVMYLTEGEKRELYKSLQLLKESDTPMSGVPAAPSTTPSSHPPGMPAVGSFHPGFPPAFAPVPGFPPAPGYEPQMMPTAPQTAPVAPASMPVVTYLWPFCCRSLQLSWEHVMV